MGVLHVQISPTLGQTGVMAYAYHGQGAWWQPYNQKTEAQPMRVSKSAEFI